MSIEFLETDFDKVSYLLNLLTARATGLASDSGEFEALRSELLSNSNLAPMLPQWLRQHRNLDSFWGFIQPKFSSYAERRTYLSGEFTPILDQLEFGQPTQGIMQPLQIHQCLQLKKYLVTNGKCLLFMT